MSVQAKLLIYAITAIACALVLGAALFLIGQQMDQARKEFKITDTISQNATELNTLTYDYLLHHESSLVEQWNLVHKSIGEKLGAKQFKNPKEQDVFEEMRKAHGNIQVLFGDLVRMENQPEDSASSELKTRLTSQLIVNSNEIIANSFQLANLNRASIEEVQQRATFMVAIFIIVLLALMIGIIYLTNTSIAQPLMRAQEGLKEAQTTSHVGSWEWDILVDKVTWSDELYRLFGLTPQEFKATYKAYLDQLHPEDQALADNVIQTAFKTHQPFMFDHRVILKDGSVRWIHGEGKVILENNQPIKIMGTAQDITERRLAEEKLRQRTEELERMNKLMVGRELKMIELKKEIAELKKIHE